MPMTYSVRKEHWLSFEAEMIAHTHLEYLMPLKWEERGDSDAVVVSYEIPAHTYTIKQLLESNQLSTPILNNLSTTLNDLNQTLQSYMLSNRHILFHPEKVLYSTQFGKFYFYYLPDETYHADYGLLDLFRHLVIEMDQLHLLKHLKSNTFDLETFQLKLLDPKVPLWRRLIKSTKRKVKSDHNPTPQKQVYPMLLDRYNPTVIYKLFFEHNTIGRDEQSNVYLDDLSISRNHAILYKSGRQFFYKDLLSTNGSKVNGSLRDGEQVIVNGDIIQIGEKEFIFIH